VLFASCAERVCLWPRSSSPLYTDPRLCGRVISHHGLAEEHILSADRWRVAELGKIRNFFHTIPIYFSSAADTAKMLLLSLSLQLVIVLWSWVVGKSLQYNLPFDVLLVTIPVILIFAMLPFSINGIGVREAAHVFFLHPFGLSTAEAVSFSLLTYSVIAGFRIISGVLFFFNFEKQVRFQNNMDA
jgi:hypothetical protein